MVFFMPDFGQLRDNPDQTWDVRWDGKVVGSLDSKGQITITDPEMLKVTRRHTWTVKTHQEES